MAGRRINKICCCQKGHRVGKDKGCCLNEPQPPLLFPPRSGSHIPLRESSEVDNLIHIRQKLIDKMKFSDAYINPESPKSKSLLEKNFDWNLFPEELKPGTPFTESEESELDLVTEKLRRLERCREEKKRRMDMEAQDSDDSELDRV